MPCRLRSGTASSGHRDGRRRRAAARRRPRHRGADPGRRDRGDQWPSRRDRPGRGAGHRRIAAHGEPAGRIALAAGDAAARRSDPRRSRGEGRRHRVGGPALRDRLQARVLLRGASHASSRWPSDARRTTGSAAARAIEGRDRPAGSRLAPGRSARSRLERDRSMRRSRAGSCTSSPTRCPIARPATRSARRASPWPRSRRASTRRWSRGPASRSARASNGGPRATSSRASPITGSGLGWNRGSGRRSSPRRRPAASSRSSRTCDPPSSSRRRTTSTPRSRWHWASGSGSRSSTRSADSSRRPGCRGWVSVAEGGERYHAARAIETECMRRAAGIVTLSETMRVDILGRGGISPDVVTVVPNAVDIARVHAGTARRGPRRQPRDRARRDRRRVHLQLHVVRGDRLPDRGGRRSCATAAGSSSCCSSATARIAPTWRRSPNGPA